MNYSLERCEMICIINSYMRYDVEFEILIHCPQIDRLMQERRNSVANALELHLSYTDHRNYVSKLLPLSV